MESPDEKPSHPMSPNQERQFSPIRSPVPNKIILQQYNSFHKCHGDYENLFNEQGLHAFKYNGIDNESDLESKIERSITKLACTCKKTECLKFYCPCFSNGQACCEGCRCEGCKNTKENSEAREDRSNKSLISCNCKKTSCLKKYCVCFLNGRKCGKECKCEGCENVQEELQLEYVSSVSPKRKYSQFIKKSQFTSPKQLKKVRVIGELPSVPSSLGNSQNKSSSKKKEIKIKSKKAWQETQTTQKKVKGIFEEKEDNENEQKEEKLQKSGKKTVNQKEIALSKKQLITK